MNAKENNFSEHVIKFILTRNDGELGDLTVEKITHALKVSQSYLYETFKNEKKVTPGKYLVMVKMFRSASLLENGENLPVKKIAHKMGFANPDYFIKIFREHFGTTPGRYRGYAKTKQFLSPGH